MPTRLTVRRAGALPFLFPLLMLVSLATLAMVSIFWLPISDPVDEITASESNVFAGP